MEPTPDPITPRAKGKALTDEVRVVSYLASLPQAQWAYTLDLIRETGLSSGRMATALSRLREAGAVEAIWEVGPSPRRRLYRLTQSGRGETE